MSEKMERSKVGQLIAAVENTAAVILVVFLALLPFVLKFFQSICGLQIPGSDLAVLHFFFLFSCLAGLITWREDRHLSLASMTDKLADKIKQPVEAVRTSVVCIILTALFLDAFCQLTNPAQF